MSITACRFENLNCQGLGVLGSVKIIEATIEGMKGAHGAHFDGGEFNGDFYLKKLKFLAGEIDELEFTIDDAQVKRNFRIGEVSVKRMESSGLTSRADLSGWVKKPPLEVYFGALSFYPGWKIYEARCEQAEENKTAIIAFLHKIDKNENPILLNGKSQPILELNARVELNLDSAEKAAAYLRFFCNYVLGEDGPFEVIVLKDALKGLEVFYSAIEPTWSLGLPKMVKGAKGVWRCKVVVRYGSSLFLCEFRINPGGMVEMIEDTPVADIKSPPNVNYTAPLRLVGSRSGEQDFWVSRFVMRAEKAPEPTAHFNLTSSLAPVLLKGGMPIKTISPTAVISLRGLTAGNLDISKVNVGPGILVSMGGLEYRRVNLIGDTTQSFSRVTGSTVRKPNVMRYKEWLGLQFFDRAFGENKFVESMKRFANALYQFFGALRYFVSWRGTRSLDGDRKVSQEASIFTPQPHEQLACALRNQGAIDEARYITVSKLELQRTFIASKLRRAAGGLTYYFFGHGLFPWVGVWICFFILSCGAIAVDFVNYGHVRWLPDSLGGWAKIEGPILVKKTENASVEEYGYMRWLPGDTGSFAQWGSPFLVRMAVSNNVEELRCGEEINAVLYALDVFVPLLDLKEEEKCVITQDTDKSGFYRSLKACYSILGALLTSLLILAIPGLLRKRVEQ